MYAVQWRGPGHDNVILSYGTLWVRVLIVMYSSLSVLHFLDDCNPWPCFCPLLFMIIDPAPTFPGM